VGGDRGKVKYLRCTGFVRSFFDNGLGENPQANDRIAHHQHEHGVLTAYGHGAITPQAHGNEMRQIDGNDMPEHNGDDGSVPGEAGPYNADMDAIRRSAKQIPAVPQGVGKQRDEALPMHEQKGEVVRHMVGNGNWHQTKGEGLRQACGREALSTHHRHENAKNNIEFQEEDREQEEPQCSHHGHIASPQRRRGSEDRTLDLYPDGGGHEAVKRHCSQKQQDKRHL
jgi:hypothetical protein